MILTGFVSSGVRLQALSDDMLFSEWERELKKRREEKKTEDYCCTTAAAHVDITRRDGTRVYCSRTADADTSRSVWCLTRCSTSAYSPAAARQKQPMVQARRRVVAFRSGPGRCYIAPPRRRRAVGPRARARARTHTHTQMRARARKGTHAPVLHHARDDTGRRLTPRRSHFTIVFIGGRAHGPVNAFKNKSRRLRRRRLVDRGDACQQAF